MHFENTIAKLNKLKDIYERATDFNVDAEELNEEEDFLLWNTELLLSQDLIKDFGREACVRLGKILLAACDK